MAARAPTCRTCAAALARCWVCGDAGRCATCQQCLRCEGLLERTARSSASAPLISVPSVRLRRNKPSPAFTPKPLPKAQTFRPTPREPKRPRAKRVTPHPSTPFPLASAVWYVRAAVVPALMLLGAYLAYDYFRRSPGLVIAVMGLVGAYLPYIVVTPVRRKGEFFPLGDEGPGLPVVMAVGGVIVGVVGGIAVGIAGGEILGKGVGIGFALVAFHAVYYVTVAEKAKERK